MLRGSRVKVKGKGSQAQTLPHSLHISVFLFLNHAACHVCHRLLAQAGLPLLTTDYVMEALVKAQVGTPAALR